jgi:hypothetical protein
MSNPIKYSTGTESLALKKGNFYIGTGDVGKGPTSTTGYYNGITPPSGGYTIYLNKESNGPSIYTASNDAQLISLTNSIAGTSYTTANECLVYFAGQTDKMVLNRNYEGIVTNGLVLNLDAGFTPSYPRSGTTWIDLSLSGNNGTLTNGPTFSSNDGGSIMFDGTNDYIQLDKTSSVWQSNNEMTIISTFKLSGWPDSFVQSRVPLLAKTSNNSFEFALWVNGNVPVWGGNTYASAFECWPSNGSGNLVLVSSAQNSLSLNTIYIVAGVFNGNSSPYGLIYINGVLKNTTNTKSGNMTASSSFMRIGGRLPDSYVASGQYLNGSVYNTQIYNRALSETEVLQNYNAQKGRFGL